MNDSESTEENDVFSDVDYMESFAKNTDMDTISYRSLVNKVRDALSADISTEVKKSSFTVFFFELLNNCIACLVQSLKTVTNLLRDKINTNATTEYLNDAVSLLQMLSDFNKNVMALSMDGHRADLYESYPENFPTTTGHIIITVFSHCSNSEKLYGDNLKIFEAQLMDLFKSCHELQLIYLLILEKHNLMYNGTSFELKVLTDALKINLKIGEIVQSLDVKTMAEQWKSYTSTCEKYNYHLTDTNLFQHCTKILCRMIRKNISCAVEENQEEKLVLRSLKVASFTIKILVKICNILKALKKKDYRYVLDLIYDVFVHRDSELYDESSKSSQFMQLMNTNIFVPTDCLIKELIVDGRFHNIILGVEASDVKLTTVYILVHTSAMKSLLYSDEFISKSMIINCALDIFCAQTSFFKIQGLFEHMLVHTAALATTLNNEDFNKLEKRMVESLLGTRCDEAMFSANLWMLLARYTTPQLVFNQIIWLCTMYKKLCTARMFYRSPQKVHLGYTLRKLFGVLDDDDKMKICKQFRVNDDDNLPLWVAIGINKLPNEMKNVAEDGVFEKLKAQFAELNNDKSRFALDNLISLLNLSATCTYTNNRSIVNTIVKAWLRICPIQQSLSDIDNTTIWFYDYVAALAKVTETILDKVRVDGASVVKVLHTVTNLIEEGDVELKLMLTKVLCKLVANHGNDYRNKINSDCLNAFSNMLQTSEVIVRNNLIITLTGYRNIPNFQHIFSKMNDEILEIWSKIQSGRHSELVSSIDFTIEYDHKCLEVRNLIRSLSENSKNSVQEIKNPSVSNSSVQEIKKSSQISNNSVQEIRKTNSSNFDFDVEMVFDKESEEPMCKKVKLDEIEIIVSRLENDASQLSNVKENVFTSEYKTRIRCICDTLTNLIN